MSEPSLPPIRERIVIHAGIETVWRTMTAEPMVPRWLGCLRYQARVGAIFFMQQDSIKAQKDDISGATHCEILVLDAPHHFRFSWYAPDFPATYVSFRLKRLSPARTEVLFEHDGWDQFPAEMIRPIFEALSNGWKSFVMPGLKRAAEANGTGEVSPNSGPPTPQRPK